MSENQQSCNSTVSTILGFSIHRGTWNKGNTCMLDNSLVSFQWSVLHFEVCLSSWHAWRQAIQILCLYISPHPTPPPCKEWEWYLLRWSVTVIKVVTAFRNVGCIQKQYAVKSNGCKRTRLPWAVMCKLRNWPLNTCLAIGFLFHHSEAVMLHPRRLTKKKKDMTIIKSSIQSYKRLLKIYKNNTIPRKSNNIEISHPKQ